MAKTKTEAMFCEQTSCGPKCLMLGVVASAVAAFGLAWVVAGVMAQWQASAVAWDVQVLWQYTLGLVLFCVAKCLKRKSCPACQ